MTGEEHAARAMLLGLWFDAATMTYRPRSPESSKYKYSRCLDADTMEPMYGGTVAVREKEAGITNTVSNKRLKGPLPWSRS